MSRIGKLPIELKDNATASVDGNTITVKGPKGETSYSWNKGIDVKLDGGSIQVTRAGDDRISRSLHGLTRSLIQNMVTGVTQGYTRGLEVNGVGYRVEQRGNTLVFTVGLFHPYEYEIPEGVSATVDTKNNKVALSSIDKQKVGQVAAEIRRIRPPEPYKGKGIKYVEEIIKRKVGKTSA